MKSHQIKKFNFLQKSPSHRNTPVLDIIKKKWVINLSSKPLSDGEQQLLQKGPKFAVSSPKYHSPSMLQLLKQSGRTVQKSTRKPKRFCNTTKTRRDTLATSPRRSRRPSKPSGNTPVMWSSQQTRE